MRHKGSNARTRQFCTQFDSFFVLQCDLTGQPRRVCCHRRFVNSIRGWEFLLTGKVGVEILIIIENTLKRGWNGKWKVFNRISQQRWKISIHSLIIVAPDSTWTASRAHLIDEQTFNECKSTTNFHLRSNEEKVKTKLSSQTGRSLYNFSCSANYQTIASSSHLKTFSKPEKLFRLSNVFSRDSCASLDVFFCAFNWFT